MDYIIQLLARHRITDVAVTTAYMPTVISDYFGDKAHGVNLRYYVEEQPLGTGGSVKNAADFLDSTFIVISGDALTDMNLQAAVDFHRQRKAVATLVLKREAVPLEYGVVITDSHGRITRFLEKPGWGEVFSDTINTGIYILEPEALAGMEQGSRFDFSKDLFPSLLKQNQPLYGYICDDYWCDIGDLATYRRTQADMLAGRVNLPIAGKQVAPGIWMESNTNIDNISVKAPVYIGSNCKFAAGVSLEDFSIIGDNCQLGNDSSLKQTILWQNTRLGSKVEARGATICDGVSLGRGSRLYEGSVVGRASAMGREVTIRPNIRLWPEKQVADNTVVSQNLVWGTGATKTLFGRRDVAGEYNIRLTPEFLCGVGAALASMFAAGSRIFVGCDNFHACMAARDAVLAGVLSTGAGAYHSANIVMPVTRFATVEYRADASIHIRLDSQGQLRLEFTDKTGADLSREQQRKLENTFNTNDFKRANWDHVQPAISADALTAAFYQDGYNQLANPGWFRSRRPWIVAASPADNTLFLLAAYLEHLGCRVTANYRHRASLENLSSAVTTLEADLGLWVDEDGQRVAVADSAGRLAAGEKYGALTAMVLAKAGAVRRLVVPCNWPSAIGRVAENHKLPVHRTRSGASHMLREILADPANKAQYTLLFDGIRGPALLLDYLSGLQTNLAEMIDSLPTYHYRTRQISCSWQDKGRILRELVEQHGSQSVELFDGVRIKSEKGWTLVLPDSERPVVNIYADGEQAEFADELSSNVADQIEELLRRQSGRS